jgi:transposase-like protein
MARQRSHSIEFKRQVAQEFIAGESLYALSKRHDISRQLIRVWVQKYEAGAAACPERRACPAWLTSRFRADYRQ